MGKIIGKLGADTYLVGYEIGSPLVTNATGKPYQIRNFVTVQVSNRGLRHFAAKSVTVEIRK
jgi:hypothetical protein